LLQVIQLVDTVFQVYSLLLLARIILSWIPLPTSNQGIRAVITFIYDVTEPYLSIFRRVLPIASFGGVGIDFSPIIAFFVLGLVHNLVRAVLIQLL